MKYTARSVLTVVLSAALLVAGCQRSQDESLSRSAEQTFQQAPADLLHGQVMAIAYSGFREGQHPDRGEGAVNPSADEILEDLVILVDHGFRLIRLYDSKENSSTTLELIRQHDLPIKVLLGVCWMQKSATTKAARGWTNRYLKRNWQPIRSPTRMSCNVVSNSPGNSTIS